MNKDIKDRERRARWISSVLTFFISSGMLLLAVFLTIAPLAGSKAGGGDAQAFEVGIKVGKKDGTTNRPKKAIKQPKTKPKETPKEIIKKPQPKPKTEPQKKTEVVKPNTNESIHVVEENTKKENASEPTEVVEEPVTPSEPEEEDVFTFDDLLGDSDGEAAPPKGEEGSNAGSGVGKGPVDKNGNGTLDIEGWTWIDDPNIKDDTSETGTIEIQIHVDEDGIIRDATVINRLGISYKVAKFYERELIGIQLRSTTARMNQDMTSGVVTFRITAE
ncbi:hypothetical protein [Algivirga pacifica]|uniref:Protein TonB, links inner and outer membranes n=1 Tax=Algivirga pacifica TaxID=1162670 RepID=A0ABP9DBF6_9BACT